MWGGYRQCNGTVAHGTGWRVKWMTNWINVHVSMTGWWCIFWPARRSWDTQLPKVLTFADLLSMSQRKNLKSERCHLSPYTPCLASTLADPRRSRLSPKSRKVWTQFAEPRRGLLSFFLKALDCCAVCLRWYWLSQTSSMFEHYIITYIILPTDAMCCPDINIENAVLSNIW